MITETGALHGTGLPRAEGRDKRDGLTQKGRPKRDAQLRRK